MILDLVVNIFLVFILVGFFNLIRTMFKVRKVLKMQKDNPNIQGIYVVNGEVKVVEKDKEQTVTNQKEMVVDPICGVEVAKEDAYHIVRAGKDYYFCSWDCREKFLANENNTYA